MFFKKEKLYRSPGGTYYTLYADMTKQPHLLIAGATHSGKSVVINGIMYTLLLSCPDKARFILIDPKGVELVQYKDVPHTIRYAFRQSDMIDSLRQALSIIEARFEKMQRMRVRKYNGGPDVYVVIDELADLMTTAKKDVMPLLQRICQIGRAANVHVIAATQCPLATVIPTAIKVNLDSRVGLRTRSAQDSRNILGINGCEKLPQYGQGYYMTPKGTTLYNIPMYSDEQLEAIAQYWTSRKCIAA